MRISQEMLIVPDSFLKEAYNMGKEHQQKGLSSDGFFNNWIESQEDSKFITRLKLNLTLEK